MKQKNIFIAACIAIITSASILTTIAPIAAQAQSTTSLLGNNIKIASVDTELLFSSSKTSKAMTEKLERDLLLKRKELQPLSVRIQDLENKLEAAQEKKALSTPEAKKDYEDYNALRSEYETKNAKLAQEYNALRAAETEKIVDQVDAIIKTVAMQEKLDLVLRSPLYASSSVDITPKILELLNK